MPPCVAPRPRTGRGRWSCIRRTRRGSAGGTSTPRGSRRAAAGPRRVRTAPCRKRWSPIAGKAAASAVVYGCAGLPNTAADGPSSTILPAYMIARRSHTSTSTDRSCVMNSIARPISCWSSFSRLEDLGLDHHVEGRGGLVRDDQARAAGERHRDHHPLLLPARELVRVVAQTPRRQADLLEEVSGPHHGFLLVRLAVDHGRLRELVPDPLDGVEGMHRSLEHHGRAGPPDRAEAARLHREHVLVVQEHLSARRRPGRQQAEDRVDHRRLPAARLARQAEDLPLVDVERHASHGRDGPRLDAYVTSRSRTERTLIVHAASG